MKKYIFLLGILFCFVGNVWGQTNVINIQTEATTCSDLNDGKITVTVSNVSAAYPIQVRLTRPGESLRLEVINDENGSAVFSGLSATDLSSKYNISVQKGTTILGQVSNVDVDAPLPLIKSKETEVAVSCNSEGSIRGYISGGTTPYTYTLTGGVSPVNITTPNGTHTFTNLDPGTYHLSITDANGCGPIESTNLVITPYTPMNGDTDTEDPLCFGDLGLVTINVSGGISDYSYVLDWEPGTWQSSNIYAVEAGYHEIWVRDSKGCDLILDFTLTEPSLFVVDEPIVTQIPCHDGEKGKIYLKGNGGTTPYTYTISGNVNDSKETGEGVLFDELPVGDYTVTVTDKNGCNPFQEVISITQPEPISFSIDTTDPKCNGESTGTITATDVAGGTGTYTYTLSGTATRPAQAEATFDNLLAGIYTITVIDENGCLKEETDIELKDPEPVEFDTKKVEDASCFGVADGSITVTAKGGKAPYTYECNGQTNTTGEFTGLAKGSYTVTITDANGCETSETIGVGSPNPVTFTADPTDVTCAGGSNGKITLTGSPELTYKLNGAGGFQSVTEFDGLSKGTYTIVADSAGCTSEPVTVEIKEPAPIEENSRLVTPASCNGVADGAITITAKGGSGSYVYSIDFPGAEQLTPGEFTKLPAGDYTITIADSKDPDCFITVPVEVTEPDPLMVSAVATKLSCNTMTDPDGTITVTVSGGTAPYTYALSGTITRPAQAGATFENLPAGTYTVTVTDKNGCEETTTADITAPADIKIEILQNPATIDCHNGTATLTVNAAGELLRDMEYRINSTEDDAWQENNIFPDRIEGTYRIEVRYTAPYDHCPPVWKDHVISVPDEVSFTLSATGITCNGKNDGTITVTAQGGNGTYEYAINPPDAGQYQANNVFTGLGKGSYEVYVKDNKGCEAEDSQTIAITEPDELTLSETHTDVSCPEDAADGTITVTVSGGTAPYKYSDGTTTTPATDAASYTFTGLEAGSYTITVTDVNGCEKTIGVTLTRPDEITFTAVPDNGNLACEGATTFITVTITSPIAGDFQYRLTGRPAWQDYSWSGTNTIENVGPGSHTVEVVYKDATACITNALMLVEIQPLSVTFGLQGDPNLCAGATEGKITIVNPDPATGVEYELVGPENRGPQTGLVFENLPGGSYTIIARVIADGCEVTQGIELSDPAAITIDGNYTVQHVTCYGESDGSITVNASGGTAPLQYAISPSLGTNHNDGTFTGLPAGNYVISVTDANNCAPVTIEIAVTQPAELTAEIKTEDVTHVDCFGNATGSATVTVTGGTAPYAYLWSTGATGATIENLTAGTYTVDITDDHGCTATASVTIGQPAEFSAALTDQADITCSDKNNGYIKIEITGGTAPYVYSINGSLPQQVTGTEIERDDLIEGTYEVVITDANGCTTSVENITISRPSEITGTFTVEEISCNGASDGKLTITASGGNVAGGPAPVYTYLWSTGETTASIENLGPGDYWVEVNVGTNCTERFPYTLTEPDELEVMPAGQNVSCNGADDGAITLAVTGGTPEYSYLWSGPNGFNSTDKDLSGLAPGTYTVTVTDAKGCEVKDMSITLTEPSDIMIDDVDFGEVACAGEETTLTVTATGDGKEILAYSLDGNNWQQENTFTVTAGDYTVYVGYWISATEAKCIRTEPVHIPGRQAIVITAVTIDDPILPCDQTSTKITIEASGENGAALQYRIDPNDNTKWQTSKEFTAGAGTYTACVRYADLPNCPVCVDTAVIVDQDIDIEIKDVTVTGDMDCPDSKATVTITATGNGKPLEYDFGDGTGFGPDASKDLPAGSYDIRVRYENENCPRIYSKNPVVITAPAPITFVRQEAAATTLDCAESLTSMIISATGEPGRIIEYSIDGGNSWPYSGTSGEEINIPDIAAAQYVIQARYQAYLQCGIVTGNTITITAPDAIVIRDVVAGETILDCFDATTTITVDAKGHTGYALEYSIDNGANWTTDPVFTDVPAGDYQVIVRYRGRIPGCDVPWTSVIEITAPAEIQITQFVADSYLLECAGAGSTTTVTITASGDKPMEYSIDNGQTWYANDGIFDDVVAGTYTACVRYAGTDCQVCSPQSIIIKSNSEIQDVTLSAAKDKLNCNDTEGTLLIVTVDPAVPSSGSYEYNINSNDPNGNWIDDVSQLKAEIGGTYVVYVRNTADPTCTQSSNPITIMKPQIPVIDRVFVDEADCFGDLADITVTAYGDDVLKYILLDDNNASVQENNNGKFTDVPAGTYTIRVEYTDPAFNQCFVDWGNTIEIKIPDEIQILDVIAGETELTCHDAVTTLTVQASGSKEMEFSIDGGTTWYGNGTDEYTFTDVGAATYTAQVRYKTGDPDSQCMVEATGAQIVTITAWAPIVMNVIPDKVMLECTETFVNVTITATGEPGKELEFSINGATWISSATGEYTFSVVAGTYTPSVRYADHTDCFVSQPLTIDQNVNIIIDYVTIGNQNLDCAGDETWIEIGATGDAGKDLEYILEGSDGTRTQVNDGRFENVKPGTYVIKVQYQGESCAKSYGSVTISAPDEIIISAVKINGVVANSIDLDCNGERVEITVEAKGSKELEYAINDLWQPGKTFTNIPGGTYIIKVRYADGQSCEKTWSSDIKVNEPHAIHISDVLVGGQPYSGPVELACADDVTTIKVLATGDPSREMEVSINGVDFLPISHEFINITPGTYHPQVRYKAPYATCAVTAPDVEIIAPDPIVVNDIYPEISPLDCDGTGTTKIIFDITGSDPFRRLEYKVNDSNWMTDPGQLPEVGIGSHTVRVRYQNYGCEYTTTVVVQSNSSITGVGLTANNSNLSCNETTTVTVTVQDSDPLETLQYRLRNTEDNTVTVWQESDEFTGIGGGTYVAEVSYVSDQSCLQYSAPLTITQLTPIRISDVYITHRDLDCYNDKTDIIVTAEGKQGETLEYVLYMAGVSTPFTNNTGIFTGMGAGRYTLTVQYAGGRCQAGYPVFEITQPDEIRILQVTGDLTVECADGLTEITLIASGDQARKLEYSVNGGLFQESNAFRLGKGTYQFQVRYQSPYAACVLTHTPDVIITGPDDLIITKVTQTKDMVDCDDPLDVSEITVTVNTGETVVYSFDGGLTYQTSNKKEVGSGSYNICVAYGTVTDPTCPTCWRDPIVVNSNSDIRFISITPAGTIECNGGTTDITVMVSGSEAIEVSIDGVNFYPADVSGSYIFTGIPAGNYTISARYISDPACIKVSGQIIISEPAPVELRLITVNNVSGCNSEYPGYATIEGVGGSGSYEYNLNNNGFQPMPVNPYTITGLGLGDHTVELRDSKGCAADAAVTFSVTNPDLIQIISDVINIRCYGEANGQIEIRVRYGNAPYNVELRDDNGVLVGTGYIANNSDKAKFEDLPSGTYWVTVSDSKTCTKTERIDIRQPNGPLVADYVGYNICPDAEYGSIYPVTSGGWPDYVSYWYNRKTDGEEFTPMQADGNGNATGGYVPDLGLIEEGQYQIVIKDQVMCVDTTWVTIVKLEKMTIDDALTYGVRCESANSGSVKIVNPQGGNGGPYWFRVRHADDSFVSGFEKYQYWNNDSIFGLPQGSFIIEMKDVVDVIEPEAGSCGPLRIPVNIGTEESITIEKITISQPDCEGDEVSITDIRVVGTVHNLQFKLDYPDQSSTSWKDSPVFEHLPEGQYTVHAREVNGDGCITQKDTLIKLPGKLQIATTVIEPKCDNVPTIGEVTITVTGGIGKPEVDYNGTVLDKDKAVQGDPDINEWTYTVEVMKGGKVQIVATDESGCTATEDVEIPYTPGLEYAKQDKTDNECPDDRNGTITVLARSVNSYVPGELTYELYQGESTKPGDRLQSIPQKNIGTEVTFTGLANGTYTVSVYDDKNPQACFTEDWVVTIDNTNKITLTNVTVVDNDCNGYHTGRIMFTIVGDPVHASYKYTINGSQEYEEQAVNGVADIFIGENSQTGMQGLIAGTYEVKISYGLCVHTETFQVGNLYTVEPTLTAQAVTGCYGDANGAIGIDVPDRNGVPYTYWYNQLADDKYEPFVPTFSQTTTITGLRSSDYKVVVKNARACLSDTLKVIVPDAPRMQISYTEITPITCKGNYGTVEISITGGSGDYTPGIVPQGEGGYPSYAQRPVLNGTTLSQVTGGLYRIAVVDNITGCKDTLDMNINAPQTVEIKVSHNDIICAQTDKDETKITVNITKPASGSFIYRLNEPLTTPGTPTTDLSHEWSVIGGTYEITVQLQGDGCLADTTIMVYIAEPIKITEKIDLVDLGKCEYIADVTLDITGGQAPYRIYFDGAEIQGNVITGVEDGTYPVRVTDAAGCEMLKSVTVTLPEALNFIIDTPAVPDCNSSNIEIEVRTLEDYIYQWYYIDTTNVSMPDTLLLAGETNRRLIANQTGKYMVNISNGSCSVDTAIVVKSKYNITAKMSIAGDPDKRKFCPGEEFTLNGSVTVNGNPATAGSVDAYWFLPNGESVNFFENNPIILGAQTGTYTLHASTLFKNDRGEDVSCSSEDTVQITLKPVPTVIFEEDSIYIPEDEIFTLKIIEASDYVNYEWNSTVPGYTDGLPVYPEPLPASVSISSPKEHYWLSLTLTGDNGCSNSDTIFVSYALNLFIPNAFTPNSDGVHDHWIIYNLEQYTNFGYGVEVGVFTRAGVQVFSYKGSGYNDLNNAFDGRHNGSDLPIGTYYYVVKIGPHIFKGSLTILR